MCDYSVQRPGSEGVKKLKTSKIRFCESLIIKGCILRFSAFRQFFHSFSPTPGQWCPIVNRDAISAFGAAALLGLPILPHPSDASDQHSDKQNLNERKENCDKSSGEARRSDPCRVTRSPWETEERGSCEHPEKKGHEHYK
jgi:hypothetical protein